MSFTPSRPLDAMQRVIVVGASSGIGAALVRQLAQSGNHVAALARRIDELNALCDALPTAKAYPHDVTDFGAVPALFNTITQELGGLDMIIYAAGVQPAMGPSEYDFAKDQKMVEINLLGAMAWLNQAALVFERKGSGHIVGIGSVAGDRGRSAFPGYHTSKGALAIYLEALRNRIAKKGAHVTTIKPGFVQTRLLENAAKTFWVITPDEAAESILNAVKRKKQVVYVPLRWQMVMLIIQHIPSFVFRRLSI